MNSPANSLSSVTAVLPAYNEVAAIEGSVRQIAGVLSALVDEFEVIVVDDGSRDGTHEILSTLQHSAPELCLRVVIHETNRGYGAALASGFDAATKDLIFFTDADAQFDTSELPRFLATMDDDTDIIVGYRFQRADPAMRRLNAWGWNLLVKILFGYTARDVDCAFKLFKREVWESAVVHSLGATFSAEFLVKARRLGFRFQELPVTHLPRTSGSATGARPAVIIRAFKELVQLRYRLGADLGRSGLLPRLGSPRLGISTGVDN